MSLYIYIYTHTVGFHGVRSLKTAINNEHVMSVMCTCKYSDGRIWKVPEVYRCVSAEKLQRNSNNNIYKKTSAKSVQISKKCTITL